MSIINFNLTQPLEKKISRVIREEGFISKAEFFRFIAWRYLEDTKDDISQEELDVSVRELTKTIEKKFKGKKLPSLEEQLAGI